MQELGNLIQDLPLWLQAVIVIVVIGVGAAVGVKIPKKDSSSFTGATKQKSKSTLIGQTKKPSPKRPGQIDDTLSPGQAGAGATRDLPAAALKTLKLSYAPSADGTPDPGEVVWTWVPFVEQDGRGKDRPVLIIGRIDESSVAGCYLSTKEHRGFLYVGPGPWDSKGRPSYLNPERVLRITDEGMRREGAVVAREQFERVARDLVAHYQR